MNLFTRALALCVLPAVSTGSLNAQEGATPPQTPPDVATASPTLTKDDMLKLLKESIPFDIHGGILLWSYKPFMDGAESNSEIYYANLLLDTSFEKFGYHFETRLRYTKLRPYFESNIWIQENYLSWSPAGKEGGMLKVGKIYSQFGRFWDGTFYGNIPYFDGLKLDPDIGLSWENHVTPTETIGLDYSVQYFAQDGATNGSLQGRDTLSIGTERNVLVARVAPTFKLADDINATIGVSGMHFDADLNAPAANSDVTRGNAEASLSIGDLTIFGDFTHQHGNHVVNFPVPGSASSDIDYLMSGVSYDWNDFTFRFSYSYGDYKDEDVKQDLLLPGIVYRVNKNLSLWLEYVYWNNDASGTDTIADRSINVIIYASF